MNTTLTTPTPTTATKDCSTVATYSSHTAAEAAIKRAKEALADMRWQYASTLDEAAAEEYETAFNRAVAKRWPPLGLEIENR